MKLGRKNAFFATNHRHLYLEPLEDRRMLAVFDVTSLDDSGAGSLRDAITSANGNGIADTINFSVVGSINLASQLPTITESLAINGPGAELLTIDAGDGIDGDFNTGDGYRIVAIDDGNDLEQVAVSIGGLKLTGGDAGAFVDGGAIFNAENLTLAEVELIANASSSDGGAVVNLGGLTVTGSTISGNAAGSFGGGVYSYEGTVSFSSSTISGNTAGREGGGVYSDGGTLSIIGSTVTGNRAGGDGGGLYNDDGVTLSITSSTISGNMAGGDGGGLTGEDGTVTITDSSISGNTAGGDGGGIYSDGDTLSITGSTISGNAAGGDGGDGGGVNSDSGSLTITDSTISGNTAGSDGGGVYVDYGTLAIIGSTVSGNTAGDRGGGVYIDTELSLAATIDNSTISGNTAIAGPGGGVCNRDGLTVILATTITGNTAAIGNGSGVASFGHEFARTQITGSIIADNTNEDVAITIFDSENSFQSNGFNLVGSGGGLLDGLLNFTAIGDLTRLDPLLGPLADNGGPTLPNGAVIQTHALLPGSPAIDAGDSSILFNPFDFDQRGDPFVRVAAGVLTGVPPTPRIDIGSYEAQAPPSADFNDDLKVNGRDFLSWQRAFGQSGAAAAGGDSDHDGDADASDLAAWQVSYGDTIVLPPMTGAVEAVVEEPSSKAAAFDAALSLTMFADSTEEEKFLIDELAIAEVSRDAYFARSDHRPATVRSFRSAQSDVQVSDDEQKELESGLTEPIGAAWDLN